MFKKENLKDGMIVKDKEGSFYLVVNGVIIREDGWNKLSSFKENLEHVNYKGFDIEKVWKIKNEDIGYLMVASNMYEIEDCSNDHVELVFDRENEVDWSNVPKDTKVLVRHNSFSDWTKRYFSDFEDNKIYCFDNGATSFTAQGSTDWKYAKLYK